MSDQIIYIIILEDGTPLAFRNKADAEQEANGELEIFEAYLQ